MSKKKIFLSLFLLLVVACVKAQSEYGTWTSISIDKKINKKWGVEAETELRTIYYVRLINRWSVGLNATYKIIKPLEINAGYQLMNVLDEKYLNYQFRNRFEADATGKQKLGDFSFSLAEGIQVTTKNDSKRTDDYGIIDTYKINPAWMWKNSLQTEYNIPKCKLTPGFEFKTYYTLNDPDGNSMDKLRYTLYFKYKLNKRNSVNIFGVLNKELGKDEADYSGKYIVGVKYNYTWK